MFVYLDASSEADTVVVGLYTNSASDEPETLLAQATIVTPVAGTWNGVEIPAIQLTAGTPYWLAVLGPVGTGQVRFRDVIAGGGPAQTSAQTNLSSLPSTWSPGTTYDSGPISGYVIQVDETSETSYTYDPVGNRKTMVRDGNTTNSTYDRADRITAAGPVSYTVDAKGNLVARGSDTFAYDQANRLTSATIGGATSSYAYDGDGKRASKTVGGNTTSYTYDANRSLPVVLDDGARKYL